MQINPTQKYSTKYPWTNSIHCIKVSQITEHQIYSQILSPRYTSHLLQTSPGHDQIQVLQLVYNLLTGVKRHPQKISIKWGDFAMKKCAISWECGLHVLECGDGSTSLCSMSASSKWKLLGLHFNTDKLTAQCGMCIYFADIIWYLEILKHVVHQVNQGINFQNAVNFILNIGILALKYFEPLQMGKIVNKI